MKKQITTAAVLLFVAALSGCGNNTMGALSSSSASSALKASSSSKQAEKDDIVSIMNSLAGQSKSTGEIYVTGDMKVGKKNTLKPGIYDMTVTGGSGNVMGTRKSVLSGMPINWAAGVSGTDDNDYPSKIRIILLNGDILKMSNISKVSFTAIPEKVTPTNELGIGNYVVGRDIKPGTYKLSTNMKMDSEFSNLGWSISIYNDGTDDSTDKELNPGSPDVAVELKKGEIITTSFDNTDNGTPTDNAKLTFTPVN
ncbi:MAG: hypothetical protein L0H98_08545 [Lacticaseibacillus paracasei]|nr:hypothetical protein [Lacticaseibacillus paracasei]MDN6006487.1 hypothetical protein [Lacticaseibacillus paracasei]MDN6491855.1 hypothetical protein [Leuconostoc sp.]MDN6635949.1 hypothetical protein [Lacticaseibacillus paracasei]